MSREIDIFDVFQILWSRPKSLGLALIIGTLSGLIYLYNIPQKSEVSFFVNKLPEANFVDLDLIYKNSNVLPKQREALVNAQVSYSEFETMFLSRTELANAALKHSGFIQKLQSDQKENTAWTHALKIASQYDMSPYAQTRDGGVIRYKTADLAESYKILVTAVEEISRHIAIQNRETIQTLISNMEVQLSNEIQTITSSIEVAEKAFLRDLDAQIVFLRGQLAIAEKLGITEPTARLDSASIGQSLGEKQVSPPAYLKGSRAIQAELELISSRKLEDAILIDTDLRLLYERRDALLADNSVSFMKRLAANARSLQTDFRPVNIDFNSLDVKSTSSPPLVIALFIVAALLISTVITLFNYMALDRLRQKAN